MKRTTLLLAMLTVAALVVATPSSAAQRKRVDRIAFTSTRSGNADVWAAGVDGSDQRRLTTDPLHDVQPDISSDGRWVVFARGLSLTSVPQSADLWIMRSDGTEARPLVADPATTEFRPDFSRDGRQVLFSRADGSGTVHELWTLDLETKALRRVAANANYGSWAPDGRRIVLLDNPVGGGQIAVLDLASGVRRRLTSEGGNVAPQWSPDGSRIVFTSFRRGDGEVWVMDADGSDQHVVAASSGKDGLATWSPDSRYIAFGSTRDTPCPPQLTELCPHRTYVATANGDDPQAVPTTGTSDLYPVYFPRPR